MQRQSSYVEDPQPPPVMPSSKLGGSGGCAFDKLAIAARSEARMQSAPNNNRINQLSYFLAGRRGSVVQGRTKHRGGHRSQHGRETVSLYGETCENVCMYNVC